MIGDDDSVDRKGKKDMALMTKKEVETVLSDLYEEEKFTGPDRFISFSRLYDFFPSKEAVKYLANPRSSAVEHELPIEFFSGDSHYDIDKLIAKLESILRQGPTLVDTSNWDASKVY